MQHLRRLLQLSTGKIIVNEMHGDRREGVKRVSGGSEESWRMSTVHRKKMLINENCKENGKWKMAQMVQMENGCQR